MFSNPFFQAFAVTIVIAILGWVMSLVRRDASIADFFWPWLGVVNIVVYLINAASPTSVAIVVFGIVVVGAVRLALFVAMRLKRQGEDRRYAEIRAKVESGICLEELTWNIPFAGDHGFPTGDSAKCGHDPVQFLDYA